jgi:hypothetical protein
MHERKGGLARLLIRAYQGEVNAELGEELVKATLSLAVLSRR